MKILFGRKPVGLITVMAFLLFALNFLAGCANGKTGKDPVVFTFYGTDGSANSYIAASAGKAAVIDPAVPDKIIAALKDNKLQPEVIILTHGHFDHISGVDAIKEKYPEIRVLIHPADMEKLADPAKNLSTLFGARVMVRAKAAPLKDEARIKLGEITLKVAAAPGHSPGSITVQAGNYLFSGDTLFKGTVGRTDFPDSSPADLAASLRRLFTLADETEVMPGHGELTTMGYEKKNNPYMK